MLKISTLQMRTFQSLMIGLILIPIVSRAQLAINKPKFLGNVIGNYVPSNFETYWNQVTPENSGKWGTVEGTKGIMNWTNLDKAYNYAKSKNYPFKQHAFVWGMQEPGWISTLPAPDQAAEVEEWMRLYAQRYPLTDLIDVVNEPLHVIPSFANALGGSGSTGWDWVIWSFQKARQYCPNAKLILNDYGILGSKTATTNYLKIINLLKTRGLIDGIGVQAHGLEYAQSSTIQANLNSLAQTGIPIYVSELDLEHADDITQRDMYKRVFPLLYEHPGVTAVTLWGYIIGEHWKPNAYLLGAKNTLGTKITTTAFQDYTFTGTGKVQVHLTNDDSNNAHDLEVDYAIIDGVIYQAEDMLVNTGVWTGTCGGSYSQMLNCNGYIEFPKANSSITVRARGIIGTESMEVRTLDDTKERLALQWLKNEYFGSGTGNSGSDIIAEAEGGLLGGTIVANSRASYSATGYATGFDAAGDYVEMNVNLAAAGTFPLTIRYAADVPVARSVKVNGSVVKKNLNLPASTSFTNVQFSTGFLAGKNIIRIYVERGGTAGGDIDYIKLSGATPASSARMVMPSSNADLASEEVSIFPNPTQNGSFQVSFRSLSSGENLNIEVIDGQGRTVFTHQAKNLTNQQLNTDLPSGLYLVRFSKSNKVLSQKKLVITN